MTKKIFFNAALERIVEEQRAKNKKIVFTNGCFDILHYGHVSYLQKAKTGDDRILIIGVNSDKSVKSIKGDLRPIINQENRIKVLAALEPVDYVTLFDEDTPERLIKLVKPDVLVKGADWKGKGVVGSDFVTSYGGCVEYIEYKDGLSTSNIIKKIIKNCKV